MSLLDFGVGDCEFTVDHLELLVLLEKIVVAFLQFDGEGGQRSSLSPGVRQGGILYERLLKTENWDEWLCYLFALEFDLCLQVLVAFFRQIVRVGTPENKLAI